MLDVVINYLKSVSNQDYLIFWVSFILFIFFTVTGGVERIFKAYLGIVIGFLIFCLANYTIISFNDSKNTLDWLKDYFINHKNSIGYVSAFFIPILAIMLPFNTNISFKLSGNQVLNGFFIIIFGFLFFPFLLSIFIGITNNSYIFSISSDVSSQVNENYFIKNIYEYLAKDSSIFAYLEKNSALINFLVPIFIFYQLTIAGLINNILGTFFSSIGNFFKRISEKK